MPRNYRNHKQRRADKDTPVLLRDAMPLLRCPCGKVFAPTKDMAKNLRRQIAIAKETHNEVRYYQCHEGAWHWTEQLIAYQICRTCGDRYDPAERTNGYCPPCVAQQEKPPATPGLIPTTTHPTPNLFARRTA